MRIEKSYLIETWRGLLLLFFLVLCSLPLQAQDERPQPQPDGVEDILRFVPMASVYVLKGCGVESASSWRRLLVNNAASLVVGAAVTYSVKFSVSSERPDHSDDHGFPSGHSMVAFAGAHLLAKEYGHHSPWISVAGYATATAVSIERIRHDHHNWWQCAAGAAIGIGATEVGYWIGDKLTGERSRLSVVPTPNGIDVAYTF